MHDQHARVDNSFVPITSVRRIASDAPPEGRALPRRARRHRILFLHPKTLVDSWPFPVDTLGEIIKAPNAVYPLLAALIEHLPIDIEIFDGYVARETLPGYRRRLQRADILAISCMSPLKALDTELTIRLARAVNPEVCIILGGNHATAYAERWIEQAGADFVVTGEGEIAFPRLIERLLGGGVRYDDLGNLVYRSGGRAVRTNVREARVSLDDAPMPRWDRMDLRPYGMGMVPGSSCAAIEMSRGCPHRCDFCNINTFWDFKQRYKSVERVLEEMEQLHRLGVREFIFTDDNFGANTQKTFALLEAMIARKFEFRWGSFLRGDTVRRHPEFAKLAGRSGMRFALMGIESLDREWLSRHGKGVRADDVVDMYRLVYERLRNNGVFLLGLFIEPPRQGSKGIVHPKVDGWVCDFHYTADLVAQGGSQLYDRLAAESRVGKDMFYHDWNMGSILLPDGAVQGSRKGLITALRENVNPFVLASFVSKQQFRRRIWWRHVGLLLERLLCTRRDDVERYRIANDDKLSLAERQQRMVESVLNDEFLNRLLHGRAWISPLSIRNGFRSSTPASIEVA